MNIPGMVTMMIGMKKQDPSGAARALYAGKEFYIKNLDGTFDGPRADIYYAFDRSNLWTKFWKFINREPTYKFIQVINGTPKRAFYADEIMVTQNGK